ncbi:MAG: Citrate lyase acyl carrier protein [Candidatus Izimaplasma bacterium HR2]|nr:MAG: Citrate lyase acyl carrier protein [Candidatus Izimaplasma bacterium HR2]
MKTTAGSLESSDCLITISDSDTLDITIESVVFKQFGDDILEVITNTLKEHKIDKLKVLCQDKGALDYTIKSRLETAILRRGENNE